MTRRAVMLGARGRARIVALHDGRGRCPGLDWHIVASPDGVLSGMFTLPDRKMIASISGSIVPHVKVERFGPSLGGNPQIREFRIARSAAEVFRLRKNELAFFSHFCGVLALGVAYNGSRRPSFNRAITQWPLLDKTVRGMSPTSGFAGYG